MCIRDSGTGAGQAEKRLARHIVLRQQALKLSVVGCVLLHQDQFAPGKRLQGHFPAAGKRLRVKL